MTPDQIADLDEDPELTIRLCVAAHARVLSTVDGLTDEVAHSPSRLPGWTVAHTLTHIARNAEGHAVRLEGALRGEDLPRYPGGGRQRDADIDAGSTRRADELVADLAQVDRHLESVWDRCVEAGWPNREFTGSDSWPTTSSPSRRLREVEMHHVDLGLGYEPTDWPVEYVEWELPGVLATASDRLPDLDSRQDLLAWLTGRGGPPTSTELGPWRAR